MKQTQAHQVKKTKCFAYHVQEYHLQWEAVKFIFLVRLCCIERGAPGGIVGGGDCSLAGSNVSFAGGKINI